MVAADARKAIVRASMATMLARAATRNAVKVAKRAASRARRSARYRRRTTSSTIRATTTTEYTIARVAASMTVRTQNTTADAMGAMGLDVPMRAMGDAMHTAVKSHTRGCMMNQQSAAPQETQASLSRWKTQTRMSSHMNRVADHVTSDSSECP